MKKNKKMTIYKFFCDTIFKLYLYSDMTKMIHYSTNVNSTHELADDIRNEIIDFADNVAEQFFGLSGNPSFTDFSLKHEMKDLDSLEDICKEVTALAEAMKRNSQKIKNSGGIVSAADDFIGKMGQSRFLSTFDKLSK